MENKCFRSSINHIPKDQAKLRNSAIPFFLSLEFQREGFTVPVIQEALIRCEKCKAYLNPYVEIISPGYKWKCNLCESVNETSVPFQMRERRTCEARDAEGMAAFNRATYLREELTSDVYEIEAPETFNVATPEQPVVCFLVDASSEAVATGVLSSVLSCVRETLRSLECDRRTKAALVFFSEAVFVLNNNMTFTAINGDVPLILSERMLFTLSREDENSFFGIDASKIETYFEARKTSAVNYLLGLRVCGQALRSATLFSFISAVPNYGEGRVEPSGSLVCKNSLYKEIAELFVKKGICNNLFIMARGSVELSSIKIPSQYTGGQVLYYPNYDGAEAASTAKFYCDMTDYFARESNFGAVCRVRASEGIVLKSVYGHFYQKGSDLLSYANYNPCHNINFSLQLFNDVKTALYVQVAMARLTKNGRKLIRVMNIAIPAGGVSFYDTVDAYAVAHCLCLDAFYHESKRKLGGKENLESRLVEIWRELKTHGRVPDCLQNLPTLVSALTKGVPFRPDLSTPLDFRGFYMYMLSNYSWRITDLMIYPVLLNVLMDNVAPLPLSVRSVDKGGLYILDTGVNLIFYVGQACDRVPAETLFGSTASGPFLFNPVEDEFSKYVSELVVYLTSGRAMKPKFVLADGRRTSVYNDIFFSYMYEDSLYQLPSAIDFRNTLSSK